MRTDNLDFLILQIEKSTTFDIDSIENCFVGHAGIEKGNKSYISSFAKWLGTDIVTADILVNPISREKITKQKAIAVLRRFRDSGFVSWV